MTLTCPNHSFHKEFTRSLSMSPFFPATLICEQFQFCLRQRKYSIFFFFCKFLSCHSVFHYCCPTLQRSNMFMFMFMFMFNYSWGKYIGWKVMDIDCAIGVWPFALLDKIPLSSQLSVVKIMPHAWWESNLLGQENTSNKAVR